MDIFVNFLNHVSVIKRIVMKKGSCSDIHDYAGARSALNRDVLLSACTHSCCTVCEVKVTENALVGLVGRPMVVSLDKMGDNESLYLCSHCTFHNIQCRLRHSPGQFNKLGAPMNLESSRLLARMLGDTKENEYLIVIV